MASVLLWLGLIGLTLIGVTWVVYPVFIWLLSLLFPLRRLELRDLPMVSVILATRDEPGLIRHRVEDVLRTSYPRECLEIVVALDVGAPQGGWDFGGLPDEAVLHVVRGADPGGKAATLNSGVEHARGELLVFADSGQEFAPDAIPQLVAAFSDPRIGAASGNLVLRKRKNGVSLVDFYWTFEKWLRRSEARIHSPVGVTGAISGVRASLWKPLPSGLILDDVYTPMRLVMEGQRVAFVSGSVAFETRSPTVAHEHLRKVRTQTGILQLCAWLPQLLVPWRNPLFLQFVVHKLFRLLTPFAAFLVFLSGVWMFSERFPRLLFPTVISLGVLSLWVGVGWPAPVRFFRSAVVELFLTQVAVVKATLNGFRGRWGVWN